MASLISDQAPIRSNRSGFTFAIPSPPAKVWRMGRTNEVQARAGISSASRHRLGGSDARSILWNPCASATAVIASHDFGDAALSRLRLQPLLEQRPRGPEAELPLQ